jgi:predicted CXXCH cytochrome family protein
MLINPVRTWLAPGLTLIMLVACTDTNTVYRDRPPFNDPPDSLSGFLGYYNDSTHQTTCGNCHVDHQAKWKSTRHAGAYATLTGSGHAQSFCYNCHTVGPNGNDATGLVGFAKVQDPGYWDVQCESCHGPGLNHVSAPDASAPPLARISMADSTNSCGSCHAGEHNPFFAEWSQSRHGRANPEVIASYVATPAAEATCMPCHEGRNTLAAWGVNANYVEKNQANNTTTAFGQQCADCHDPQDARNPSQLRFQIDDPAPENNLCMKCHARRFEPQLTSNRGPHAPQGPVVLGSAGYWPPGYDTTALVATHGDPVANPRFCAGCHVNSFQSTDSNGVATFSTGHLFRPIPCLVNGRPVSDNSCAYDATSRTWQACTTCHSSVTAVVSAFTANRAVLKTLADALWVDTNHDGNVNAGDTGLLAQVPANQYSTADGKITIAEGALFNVKMVGEDRYDNGDKSMGVHNPFLAQAILSASIDAVTDTYGLAPPPPAVQALVTGALRKARRTPVAVSVR